MNLKARSKPIHLLKLEALYPRLPDLHPSKSTIEADIAKRTAGYKGECETDYYTNQLDHNKYFTLHDIRLPLGENFFQIDSLILSKNVHFIVGVKNIAGEVKFDGFNQMIRTYNEQSEGMQNPLSQAFLHQQQLQKWLQPYNLPPIPIEYVVVFSNPRTILTIQGGITLALKKICHAPNLLMKLQELEYKHPQPKATSEEIAEIGHLIRSSHVPLIPNILDNYKLKEKDVPTGVLCIECRHLPMIRKYGYWQCPICKTTSKDAHI